MSTQSMQLGEFDGSKYPTHLDPVGFTPLPTQASRGDTNSRSPPSIIHAHRQLNAAGILIHVTDYSNCSSGTPVSLIEQDRGSEAMTVAFASSNDSAGNVTTTASPGRARAASLTDWSIMSGGSVDGEAQLQPTSVELGTDTWSVAPGAALTHHPLAHARYDHARGGEVATLLSALTAAAFLVGLDQTILAAIAPRISDEFVSFLEMGWYGTTYLLSMCSLQVIYGKLYTLCKVKSVFVWALVIFSVGSCICGYSYSSVTFIVGRAVAGVGAAGVFSGALSIISWATPRQKRPMYTSIVATAFAFASVAGPLIGGAFSDGSDWRNCFRINIPVAFFAAIAIGVTFESPPQANLAWAQIIKKLDITGSLLLVGATCSLLLGFQWGGSTESWGSPLVVSILIFSVLLFSFFVMYERWVEEAMIPGRIFSKNRVMICACVVAFCVGASFFPLVYYLPLWFQALRGESAVKAAILNFPFVVAVSGASLTSGIAITFLGFYGPFVMVGSLLAAIGAGLMSEFTPSSPTATLIGYQFIAGVGIGMVSQQPLNAVTMALGTADTPVGVALTFFFQTLGGALFISLDHTMVKSTLIKGFRKLEWVNADPKEFLGDTGARNLWKSKDWPAEQRDQLLETYAKAQDSVFYPPVVFMGVAFFAAFGFGWGMISERKRRLGGIA